MKDKFDLNKLVLVGETTEASLRRTSEILRDQGLNPNVTIEFISKYVTLEVGDCIFTGTSGTAGQIKSGDEVIVDIENVGRLINRSI